MSSPRPRCAEVQSRTRVPPGLAEIGPHPPPSCRESSTATPRPGQSRRSAASTRVRVGANSRPTNLVSRSTLQMRHHHKGSTSRAAEQFSTRSAAERALTPGASGRLIWFQPVPQCRQLRCAAAYDAIVPTRSPRVTIFFTPEHCTSAPPPLEKPQNMFWRSTGDDLCQGKGIFPMPRHS